MIYRISPATWESTKEYWELLLRREMPIDKKRFDALVRIYIWIAINHADETDKARMLKSCGTLSKPAFEAACHQIDCWLDTLNDKQRANDDHLLINPRLEPRRKRSPLHPLRSDQHQPSTLRSYEYIPG